MYPYLDNSLAINWLYTAAVTGATTPTAVDLANAIGPVGLTVKVPSGGTGTLSLQPVMSTDNVTFVNVPADAILDPVTGLQTTFTNVTSTGSTQTVYLKRDELYRYVSILLSTPNAVSQTVNVVELHIRAYTSQSV